MHRRRVLIAVLFVAATGIGRAEHCLTCAMQRNTFRQDAADAKFVIVVRPVNDPKDGNDREATYLVIRDVLKDDPAIAKRQVLRINLTYPLLLPLRGLDSPGLPISDP